MSKEHPFIGKDFRFPGSSPANTAKGQLFEIKDQKGTIQYVRQNRRDSAGEILSTILFWVGLVSLIASIWRKDVGAVLPAEIAIIVISFIVNASSAKWSKQLKHIDGRLPRER